MILTVPAFEEERAYPTLGPLVCAWIEKNLTFGPGDLQGKRAKVDDEKRALIYRFYELMPRGTKDANGKLIEGRRRFRRCCVSLQKGSAKTELAAWIAAAELHPEAPVRFDHFDTHDRPWGHGVQSCYIPMVAYTEEQSEDLAYGVLKFILERSAVAADFDIGFERIMRAADATSKAMALAGAPDARDGALTTFAHKDETHRWTLPRLKRAHRTMLANLTKRLIAEPWELETTTAYSPGEGSVAEETANYAQAVAEGKISDSRLFYFHRQASDGYDWMDPARRRAALVEAAGPTAAWKDIDGISDNWQDPHADLPYLERVFGNRPVATSAQAFSAAAWAANVRPRGAPGREGAKRARIKPGQLITLGFDGSLRWDATALIATHVASGFQWPVQIWERPEKLDGEWEVPKAEVDAAVDEAFATYDVWRMYGDPSKWETWMAAWAGRHGDDRIVAWPTTLYRKMGVALRAYANAIDAGEATNNGDPVFARHIGNAQKQPLNFVDDDGVPLYLLRKDRPGSPQKIDAAMAGCLSWRARLDAIAAGATQREESSVFFVRRGR